MRDAHICSFSFHSKTNMAKEKKEVKKEEPVIEEEISEEVVEQKEEVASENPPAGGEVDQAAEYLNSWKRCQADFENYRKMQAEERRQLSSFASENLILQILPILDNFHASTDHIPEEQKNGAWVVGIMHIQKQLEPFLKDNGVEEIKTKVDDKFNPEIHEAIHSEEKEEKKYENKITKIISKGYKIGSKVIRAVRVIVS